MSRRLIGGLAFAVALGCIAQSACSPAPLLVWNVTASAPVGLYRRSAGVVTRGVWVLVRTPNAVADLASRRRYLPRNVPMVKRVVALSSDTVCRFGTAVQVNGREAARALLRDAQGRALPQWRGCRRLAEGELFLLTAPPLSFDSRYFGVVPGANLIERIEPLWTF